MNDRLMKTEEEVRQRAKELLQLRPEDLLTQYMFQEQEIERLKEELKYTVSVVEHNKTITKHLKEIERLNNIINESIKLTSKVNEMESARDLYDLVVDIKNKLKDSEKNES